MFSVFSPYSLASRQVVPTLTEEEERKMNDVYGRMIPTAGLLIDKTVMASSERTGVQLLNYGEDCQGRYGQNYYPPISPHNQHSHSGF